MRQIIGLALTTPLLISNAAADGETTPMFGSSVMFGSSTEESSRMAGVEIEAAWWWGPLGLALEASGRSIGDDSRTMVMGGSVRLRLLQMLVPSLLEPSDVELGIELQGIVERTWWDGAITEHEPMQRGVGFAIRLRGSTEDYAPRLITESRFFIRVFRWRPDARELAARTTMPVSNDAADVMVILGIGAAFGGGERRYLEQFRRRAFE